MCRPHACYALQISYAISVSHPLSISVFDYGTSTKDEDELLKIVQKNFDLRPGIIVKYVHFHTAQLLSSLNLQLQSYMGSFY